MLVHGSLGPHNAHYTPHTAVTAGNQAICLYHRMLSNVHTAQVGTGLAAAAVAAALALGSQPSPAFGVSAEQLLFLEVCTSVARLALCASCGC
jgi:hypothetical protein